jgi:hypothetical protein
MTLPDNFSPAEHLQDVAKLVINKQVRAEFADVGDDNWARDIGTPRGSLRVACTHMEDDSLNMTLLRCWLFYGALRKARDFHPAIYGIPSIDFQSKMTFFPQVELYFEEKASEVDPGYDPISAQVKFRLVGETSESFTLADATALANKIKANFGNKTTPFTFKKGRELWTYVDQVKGYHFQLYVFAEAEAKKVITEVLQLRSHVPDWKLLISHISDQAAAAFPTIPPNKTILGKSRKQPRKRPAGTVRYRYAQVYLYGLPGAIVLHDLSGTRDKALVK